MADFVETTVSEIDRRLAELGDERSRLEAARSALVGGSGSAAPRTKTAPNPARKARTRNRRGRSGKGSRSEQTLALIRESPGITVAQLAGKLQVQPTYLYRLTAQLVAAGQVSKQGKALSPAQVGTQSG